MLWVDFDSKLHQFKFSSAPKGHQSYSEISIKHTSIYPNVSVQEGDLRIGIKWTSVSKGLVQLWVLTGNKVTADISVS